ncbi:Mu-like prophage major head subunit gpT family protein [Serratia fonticola]|uniref:Mu-like prophage major head subunit gpT family protein n=1 Tax=Serratia fonticola TaxID=47917 RepID=UPI0016451192|nr:Mu-like prophage major head subunit gpT family protein [Serratia fonticola]MBC3252855.1 Mu-like prophage major head subunit gpT family protein [Serratia fonticola]
MIVNRDAIRLVFVNLKTTFQNALQAAPGQYSKIAMVIPSSTKTEDYGWLGDVPGMREWVGDKVVKSLSAHNYSITNKSYEATIAVSRDDLEDDITGKYTQAATNFGASAAAWPDKLIFNLVNAGFSTPCYDGQYYFDTDHLVDGQSVSNMGTAPLSVATQAAAQAGYGAARTAMMSITNEEGDPLDISPNILLVHPALEDTARTLMTTDRLEDGKPNLYKGTAEVVVSARIKNPKSWFLLDTTKSVKPFIFQQRKAPVFVSQTDMNNDDVFNRAEFKFGIESRGNAGFAFWQLAYASTGEGV